MNAECFPKDVIIFEKPKNFSQMKSIQSLLHTNDHFIKKKNLLKLTKEAGLQSLSPIPHIST